MIDLKKIAASIFTCGVVAGLPVGIASTTAVATFSLASATPVEAQVYNYSRIYLRNRSSEYMQAKIEWKDVDGAWKTRYFNLSPGENAYVVDTKNRFIYVSGKSLEPGSTTYWSEDEVNIGRSYKKFTYNFDN